MSEETAASPFALGPPGALFGPAQVGARLVEFAFGRNLHPLWVVRFALSVLLCAFVMLAFFGFSPLVAGCFALLFGGANGLVTITRGAVPLALFGTEGYGAILGVLATPVVVVTATAPTIFALIIDRWGWRAAELTILTTSTTAWIGMELMSRWYERRRGAAESTR